MAGVAVLSVGCNGKFHTTSVAAKRVAAVPRLAKRAVKSTRAGRAVAV